MRSHAVSFLGRSPPLRQVGVQLGLLTAIALVMVRGPSSPASAAPICAKEATCTTTKPLVLFVVDYSTAMNTKYDPFNTSTSPLASPAL